MIRRYVLFVFHCSLIVTAVAPSYAQSYAVKGTVTAGGTPVRYAYVTIIDNSDTSVKYYALTDSTGAFNAGTITSVKPGNQLPASFQLEQNYPNPFASKTAISYNLDKQSDVKVTIYDVLGRVVKNYTLGYQDAGIHGVIWNGRNNLGRKVAPGVYFYRLRANGRAEVRKMLFGVGAANASVSLSGVIPPAPETAHMANDVIDRPWGYYVMVTNTDSTDPLIMPQGFGYYNINSDTTFFILCEHAESGTGLLRQHTAEDRRLRCRQYGQLAGSQSYIVRRDDIVRFRRRGRGVHTHAPPYPSRLVAVRLERPDSEGGGIIRRKSHRKPMDAANLDENQ